MDGKNKPFTVIHTPNIAKILFDMKCTLALSTFQAGKVVFISAISKDRLIQLPRTFSNAMGVATSESKLAVACKTEAVVLKNGQRRRSLHHFRYTGQSDSCAYPYHSR